MQKRIVRERLEKKVDALRVERVANRLADEKIRDEMKPMIEKIREIKEEEKKEERRKKERARARAFKPCAISEHEVLNIDTATRIFLEHNMYVYRGWVVGDTVLDDRETLYMGLVRIFFRDRKRSEGHKDIGREVYIINEKAKGVSYREIGKKLGISASRVQQILTTVIYMLKHPKVGRKLIKKVEEEKEDE